jgi:hypothetical protein
MNKFFLYLFTFWIVAQVNALACNFQISNFGESKNKIKMEPFPVTFPDRFGGESVNIPMEALCKDDKSLYGTMVVYLYIEDKLSQVQLLRANMNDNKLMDYAMSKYGTFNIPEGLPKNKWKGSYQWEVENNYVKYISTTIHDGNIEILEINSKLYANMMVDYNQKVGEWLDSEK